MSEDFEDIKIVEVIIGEVTEPAGEGQGGELYTIPLRLTAPAPTRWADYFAYAWDHPGKFTSMHRPGIAKVIANKIYLSGTTMQDLEKIHKPTLKYAVDTANQQYRAYLFQLEKEGKANQEKSAAHRKEVAEIAKRIEFD